MPEVIFTSNLKQHVSCESQSGTGTTVRALLDSVFENNSALRGYVLDDQGRLRKHMIVFIDGTIIEDRVHLQDAVDANATLYVMQALSGG